MSFKKGESGNPAGKPKGANKTQKIRDRLMTAVPDILAALVDQAKTGDVAAAKAILERTLPALKPETRPSAAPVPTDPDSILQAVHSGQLTTDQADSLMAVLLAQAKIRETSEIVERLEKIETLLMERARAEPD